MDQSAKNPTDAGKKQDEATQKRQSQWWGGDLFSHLVLLITLLVLSINLLILLFFNHDFYYIIVGSKFSHSSLIVNWNYYKELIHIFMHICFSYNIPVLFTRTFLIPVTFPLLFRRRCRWGCWLWSAWYFKLFTCWIWWRDTLSSPSRRCWGAFSLWTVSVVLFVKW